MIVWIWLTLHDVSCIAAGTFLVWTEHYGWAWIPFLLAACTTVKNPK